MDELHLHGSNCRTNHVHGRLRLRRQRGKLHAYAQCVYRTSTAASKPSTFMPSILNICILSASSSLPPDMDDPASLSDDGKPSESDHDVVDALSLPGEDAAADDDDRRD